jgi:hypothetical protein
MTVSISAIARMMSRHDVANRMIGVLGAFFDDTGTHAASPVVGFGGVLGTDAQWDAFAPDWAARLVNPLPGKPALKSFHLAPCRAGDDEFQGYSRAEIDHITYLFRRLILDHQLLTVAAVVNRRAWDELVTPEVAKIVGPPEGAAFVKCVDSTLAFCRLRHPGEPVFFFFDQGIQSRIEGLAWLYRTQTDRYPEIGGMGFAKVSDVLALQAADMIATESYYYAQEWLKDGENAVANAHFREYVKRDLGAGFIFDREHIGEMVMRVRASLPGQPS